MSKILITGGAGFVGAHLAKQFNAYGHSVVALDSLQQYIWPPRSTAHENLRYRFDHLLEATKLVRGSTESKYLLRRTLDVEKPNYVVHLAALPLAGLAIDAPEEAFRSLLQGTANVLDAVRSDSTIEKLVIVSSSMVYGDFGSAPQAEGAAKSPKDLYGSLKLMGEILTGAYGGLYDIPFAIVRPSAVYGPADNNQRVVQTLLERAMQELPIYLEEPEATFLDFTSVEDLARGIAELTLSDAAMGEAFNLTYGKARSLAELVEIIRFHFPDLEVNVGARSEHFRPRRGTLDTSKAATSFGYCPSICLEDGVAAYLKYMTLHNPSLTKAPVADASPAQKPRSS